MSNPLSYSSWQSLHHDTLTTLNGKDIVISYSGGKDSSLLVDFFLRARPVYGFTLHVHGVAFPTHVFRPEDQEALSRYWRDRGVDIVWHGPGTHCEADLDRLFEGKSSPCVRCSQAKKSSLFAYFKARETCWENLVVVIGYTLWDLASATVEHALRTGFGGGATGSYQGRRPEDRFLEIAQRFYPLLELSNGLRIFKPLIQYNDTEIADLTRALDIPLTRGECRFKAYRPKRLLAEYYSLFGLQFTYADVYAFARKAFDMPAIDFFQKIEMNAYVTQMI